MKRKIISICVLICLLMSASLPLQASAENRGIVFVAEYGNDNGSGTIDNPLKTLNAAKNKIRQMKQSGNYDGYTVYIREGVYNLTEQFKLTAEDSGTEGNPIVWRNYEDEEVTIVGGVSVSGSDFKKVTDNAVLDRLIEESARDKVYSLDLKPFGIESLPEPFLVGNYSYNDATFGDSLVRPDAYDMELFVDGVPMTTARYPNEGNMTVEKVLEPGGGVRENTNPFTIVVGDDRIKKWENLGDGALLWGLWMYEWADQSVPLASVDVGTKSLTSEWCSVYKVKAEAPFYIYNLIEELDAPGEFYLDRENCILYLIPPSSLNKATITLTVMEDYLFELNGVNNVTIKGLNIMGSRTRAINIESGENNTIVDCEISLIAQDALWIKGKNNGIVDSYIHDVERGVAMSGGDVGTLTAAGNYVENCHIERFSRIGSTYNPAIYVQGVGNYAKHNEINDTKHNAIMFMGMNNLIAYNDIYDVLQHADDSGAIYGGLNWHCRGLEFKYNYIHDCKNNGENSVGIWGIYGDGGQCGMSIVGNVVENFEGGPILVNGGSDNAVINNYAINTNKGINVNDIMTEVTNYSSHETEYNKVKEAIDKSPQWHEQFPEFFEFIAQTIEQRAIPKRNYVVNNISYNSKLFDTPTAEFVDTKQNLELYEDPGFNNAEESDYNLKSDSALFDKLPGFQAIPFTRIGRYSDRAMNRAESAVLMCIGSPRSLVYGEKAKIDESAAVVPFIEDGRTYIPLRFLSESLGFNVEFDSGKITITSPTVNLELMLGSTEGKKNGEAFTLEKPPVVIDGRTLVPLRQVSEMLEKQVYWHDAGFISISDDAELFDSVNGTDDEIIRYLHEQIKAY